MSNGTSNKTPISPLHWEMILKGIYERSCVPFLGAAVNISNVARAYSGLPLGPEVALRLIGTMLGTKVESTDQLARITDVSPQLAQQGLHDDLARLWFQNLPRVALHVEVKGGDRPFLTGKLREILPDQKCEPSHLLQVLAEMPLRLIVTTNFDRLLERATERALIKSLSVQAEDLLNAGSLIRKLRNVQDPLSQHLQSQLAPATQQWLATYQETAEPSQELRSALANDLNRLLHAGSLYDEKSFLEVPLTDDTRALRDRNPTGAELLRLNRLLLEEAYPAELRRARKECTVIVQPVEGFTDAEGKEHQTNPPQDDVFIIYKIHGTFTGTEPSPSEADNRVVITEEDYIQFLTIINEPVKGIPNYVLSKLANSTLLFLGYGLEDWDFRTLHKALIEQRLTKYQRRTAFAIQWRPPKFWVDYWRSKNVQIYDCDIHDFAEDLERLYVERYGSLSASASTSVKGT